MLNVKNVSRNWIGICLGILAFVSILTFMDFGPGYRNARLIAAISAMMGVWWFTEALPLAVTAFVPLV